MHEINRGPDDAVPLVAHPAHLQRVLGCSVQPDAPLLRLDFVHVMHPPSLASPCRSVLSQGVCIGGAVVTLLNVHLTHYRPPSSVYWHSSVLPHADKNQVHDGDFLPDPTCFPDINALQTSIRSVVNATTVFSFWPEVLRDANEFDVLQKEGCLINSDLGGACINPHICRTNAPRLDHVVRSVQQGQTAIKSLIFPFLIARPARFKFYRHSSGCCSVQVCGWA